jgi:hypothetical protein
MGSDWARNQERLLAWIGLAMAYLTADISSQYLSHGTENYCIM